MRFHGLLRAMLAGSLCQALLHMYPTPTYKITTDVNPISKTLAARQADISDPSSCSQSSTAHHVAVICTPFAGVITTINCGYSSTVTTTGCDVTDETTTSTTTTITADCATGACGGACSGGVAPGTATTGFPRPTSSSTPSAVQARVVLGPSVKRKDGPMPAEPDNLEAPKDNLTHVALLSGYYEQSWLYEWSRVDPDVKHRDGAGHVPRTWRRGGRTSSRVRAFEDQAFNMGVQGLIGCTSVVLVSRRGVWMSHMWEHPTFTTNNREMWDIDVAYGMFLGDRSGEYPGLNQHSSGPGALFTPDGEDGVPNDLAIFIVTPSKTKRRIDEELSQNGGDGVTQWLYPEHVAHIRALLENTYHVRPTVALYTKNAGEWTREQREHRLMTSGLGKVIVSYFPTESDPTEPQCGPQNANLQVWVYGTPEPIGFDGEWFPIYEDIWPAYRKQLLPVNPDRIISRDDSNDTLSACPVSFQTTSTKSATPTSSSASITTITRPPKMPDITSCILSESTSMISNSASFSIKCLCNGNQIGWPSTETNTDGARTVVCRSGIATPKVPVTTIAPPNPTSSTTSSREPMTAAPDITSCSLNKYTLTYPTTIDGTVTASPSQVNVCACNDDQEATPFTVTALDHYETVLCNKRPGGPTVAASTFVADGLCATPTAINTPFQTGTCTLNMTQRVIWKGGTQHRLVYAAWDGSAIPADAPIRDKEIALDVSKATALRRCDTGFPFFIDIFFNARRPDEDRKYFDAVNSTESTTNATTDTTSDSAANSTISHVLADSEEFLKRGIYMFAAGPSGVISWEAFPDSKGPFNLPYCKVGKWDGRVTDDSTKRSIDCHWEC